MDAIIRAATAEDIPAIAQIYADIHTEEEAGRAQIGWNRAIYPTEQTAWTALQAGDLFVLSENGEVCAAACINRTQVPAYVQAHWHWQANDDEVMVLHTLVVAPKRAGCGIASRFVAFYEDYAGAHGCPVLRMDTNERNRAARSLYRKLGYREADVVPCIFNGIPDVKLVCLEKKL
ncbi:MAG: GNAT family N-acetyltransferase [Clostridia bacterium]|nr:GNAT family N-acetyltransferase [Clostridia bacterium]